MTKKIVSGVAGIATLIVAIALYNIFRHYLFLSPSEEVTIGSGDIKLAGTLVKPADEGVFPAVIMLHGAGPEVRGDMGTNTAANLLLRNGFAVLMYDKRGAGASGGNFDEATYRDFLNDAIAVVRYLADRKDIDGERIGLYSVSESGWFAPEIAHTTESIAFLINKSAPSIDWVETVLWESRHEFLDSGIAEADVDALLDLARLRWEYYQAAAADPSLAKGPRRDAINRRIAEVLATVPLADRVVPEELMPYDPESYSRFAATSSYDPAPYLMAIDIPMLYLYGGLDDTIPTSECVAYLDRLAEQHGKDITIHVFPGVGHSMATWKGFMNGGFVPGYLDMLETWTAEHVTTN